MRACCPFDLNFAAAAAAAAAAGHVPDGVAAVQVE
jgi:hypothetical protein